MRPAQLRRFAQSFVCYIFFQKMCFNEAGAAAPVCRPYDEVFRRMTLEASMRPAQLRRFAVVTVTGVDFGIMLLQ